MGDGFDWDEIAGNDDDLNNLENDFIPLVLQVGGINVASATITFEYSASWGGSFSDAAPNDPPNRRLVSPDSGSMRIWKKNGNSARTGPDAVMPGSAYPAAFYGLTSEDQTITLFIEGVNPTPVELGNGEFISVTVDPDGPGPLSALSDKVKVMVATVQMSEMTPYSGFDGTINPLGLMVPIVEPPAVGKNKFKLNVKRASVKLRSVDPAIATVPVGPYGTGDHEVEVTSVGNTSIDVIVEAYVDTPDELVLGQLRAWTMPRKTVSVKFHNVSDNFGHASTLTPQDGDELFAVLHDIWLKQANINLVKSANWFSPLTITQDFGNVIQGEADANGDGQCGDGNSEGQTIFEAYRDPAVTLNIFLMWEVEVDCPPVDNTGDSVAAYTLHGLGGVLGDQLMGDSTNQSRGRIYAHEIGHYFSFAPASQVNPNVHFAHGGMGVQSPAADWSLHLNLMKADPFSDGKHITLRQAWIANEQIP